MRDYARPSWLQRRPQVVWLLLLAPALAYLGVFFAYPVARLGLRSVFSPELTADNYTRLLTNPAYLKILWTTVRISLTVATVSLILGYPVAFFLAQARERVAHRLLALVLLPFWTSVLVRSYAWIVILGSDGLINRGLGALGLTSEPLPLVYNELGVVIGMVHVLLPYMVLSLYGVMREIDPSYLRAAQNLGAGWLPTFTRVYLPLSMPGVTSGFLLVFIFSVGFFITPALLGGGQVEMIALQIDTQINELVDWGFGSAIATSLFAVVVGLVLLLLRLFDVEALAGGQAGRRADGQTGRADGPGLGEGGVELLPAARVSRESPSARPPARLPACQPAGPPARLPARHYPKPPVPFGWITLRILTAAVLVFLVAPILIVMGMSVGTTDYLAFPPQGFTLRWYAHYLTDGSWMAATGLSLRVAVLTAMAATVLGTLAAIGLVRGRFAGKQWLYFTTLAPLIVPTIVSAVAVYFLFVRLGLVGDLWGFVLAHTVLAIPVVVLVVSAALRRADESLERAATILGAGRVRAFVEVTLPAIRPAIISGLLFAFVTSFDEIVMALFLAGTTTATLPKTMWESLRFQIDPTIAAVSTLLILLSLLVLFGTTLLGRRAANTQ